MKNHKCDRQIWKILSSFILGFGLQALFSIPALAETTDPETTANSLNSEDRVNEWYQLPAATNNLPDNFEGTPDRKAVEKAQNVDLNLPINPTSEQLLPIVSEIETNTSNASETQPAEIPPLVEENKLENPPLTDPADNSIEQVTSVSQLGDVQPTDWAFQALQSLVERYGCIAGYPDGTYRGNRAITRYEFAAGVNACLDKIRESMAQKTENLVNRDDLIKIQKLQEEFAAEIATLRGRTAVLESRSTELEANQFSPTTKLSGLTIVGIQGRTPNRADRNPRDGKRDTKDPGTNVNTINLNLFYLTTQFINRFLQPERQHFSPTNRRHKRCLQFRRNFWINSQRPQLPLSCRRQIGSVCRDSRSQHDYRFSRAESGRKCRFWPRFCLRPKKPCFEHGFRFRRHRH